MADPIQRCWMPYATAAKEYIGISPDVLLGAIKRHELPAYEKPITRQRTGSIRQNHSYFVNLSDVDAYIRANWTPAFTDSNPVHGSLPDHLPG